MSLRVSASVQMGFILHARRLSLSILGTGTSRRPSPPFRRSTPNSASRDSLDLALTLSQPHSPLLILELLRTIAARTSVPCPISHGHSLIQTIQIRLHHNHRHPLHSLQLELDGLHRHSGEFQLWRGKVAERVGGCEHHREGGTGWVRGGGRSGEAGCGAMR
jgi:hypothetical protein